MKFILGQKKQMTQVFKADGTVMPVTSVEAQPNVITQVKTQAQDGYNAIQVGSGVTKKSHRKPQLGHLKDLKPRRWLREFRLPVTEIEDVSVSQRQGQRKSAIKPESRGQTQTERGQAQTDKQISKFYRGLMFGVEIFRPGDKVRVTGVSKGRGFQGVVKRHGFHGAPASHGTKDQLRMPGSIGATGPAHVFKGTKMPGRMGTDTVTITGLQVVKVDREKNLLYISGAVPGAFNSLVMISGPGSFKLPTEKQKDKKTEEQEVENKEDGIKNQGDNADKIESAQKVETEKNDNETEKEEVRKDSEAKSEKPDK